MAAEYDATDVHGLLQFAVLVDNLWRAETPRDRQAASAEIRLQGLRFGLSPIDRRRLQWEIGRSEEAQARGRHRPATRPRQDDPTGSTPARARAASSSPSPRPEGTTTEEHRNTMTEKTARTLRSGWIADLPKPITWAKSPC